MRNRSLAVGVLLIISLIFIISGCGGTFGKSLTKVLTEAGPHAIESPPFPNPLYKHVAAPAAHAQLLGSPVSVEAWIKIDDLVNGGGSVIARGDAGVGVELSVDNATGTSRFFAADPDEAPTSVEAAGTTNVMDGSWHHLAGVLTEGGHDHSGPTNPGTTCNAAAQGDIHIDIYVDGYWENCAGPFVYPDNSTTPSSIDICQDTTVLPDLVYVDCTTNMGRDITGVGSANLFVGTIDEVRIWGSERSASQIDKWMSEEISGEDWDTADPGMLNIKGYWKFNEGTGTIATDSSGYGNNANKFQCANPPACNLGTEIFGDWYDGWVVGYQF